MKADEILQSKVEKQPIIYAYSDTRYPNQLKVGYTTQKIENRMHQHYPTVVPGQSWKVERTWSAMRPDGTTFKDYQVHKLLEDAGVIKTGEWFQCDLKKVDKAVESVRLGADSMLERTQTFKMRPEQKRTVQRTADYFHKFYQDPNNRDLTPHYLWNAKMRFGKTFTAYQLALAMRWEKVLVLTFKPAVKSAWKEDLLTHIDFKGWQFCEKQENREFNTVNEKKPFVCFASFQDVLGKNELGGIKATNEWLLTINWDCIILDEYHFGAWGSRAKDFYDKKDIAQQEIKERETILEEDAAEKEKEAIEDYDEELMPLTTKAYLYLSGTPFRAIANGEFIEDQISNWTYSDEQDAKANWDDSQGANPYLQLPQMVLMTYQMPDSIKEIAMQGEFDEFDLNEFFRAEGEAFAHEEYVQKWIDWVRGSYTEQALSDLKLQTEKPPMPFSDVRLKGFLQHTLWFLPSIASCKAMKKLLESKHNIFFSDYKVILAAGNEAGMGVEALKPVYAAMDDPYTTKTITLSCGKLTTGVTVKPWTGILMLRNSSSPETYFQAAFRVQSPWVTYDTTGNEEILKKKCYVFDFAPDRALKQVADYSCRLNMDENNPEKKVEEFIKFLPVIAYDGSSMKEIDAAGILDMAMSGTTATLLARRWESALLVNVDNYTLKRLLENEDAMKALMNIEGFRALREDIETIINKSDHVKKVKKEKDPNSITAKEKKELTEEEKEFKSKRKEIQEKLIKFATRIPVFMYLTDYREYTLRDVITQLEPELFRKVTGLTMKDFELLVSLGVFKADIMNDAVYKFKRYEDSSLEYTGIKSHTSRMIGAWDTVLNMDDMEHTEENEQEAEEEVKPWENLKEGDTLVHKTFGEGKITEMNFRDDGKTMVKVKFNALNPKCFLIPDSFEKDVFVF